MSAQLGPDMPYSDIIRVLRRYGGKRRRLVSIVTIARGIGYPIADTLFYLQRMEEWGIVERVPDAGDAARLKETP